MNTDEYLSFSSGIGYDKTAFPGEDWQVQVCELKAQHGVVDPHANRVSEGHHQILDSCNTRWGHVI